MLSGHIVLSISIITCYLYMYLLQYPLGLFDTNETKTADVIQLLRGMQPKYVPYQNDQIAEEVFFGGEDKFKT